MLQTDEQWPAVSRQTKGLQVNPDTSVDIYFGPSAPAGKESNLVQTIPARAGIHCCACMVPCSRDSTRPGDPARSSS